MDYYQQKKDYKVSKEDINTILEKLESISCESVHYIGYADKNLIIALKEKYKVSLGDYFDKTDFSLRFWSEGSEEEGFTLDGSPVDIPPLPNWMEGLSVSIEGIFNHSSHDVLILDIPLEAEVYPEGYPDTPAAKIVFLLGDADSSSFTTHYTWSYEGVWVGRDKSLQREKDLFEEKISKANGIIDEAEAIIITAGAGMGVNSGLPDFRGDEGFWKAYPPIAKLGYDFTQMANPALFTYNPKLAWGFYGHRLNLYRSTIPHKGFGFLLDLADQIEGNYFVFTSNVDGQFQKAGFDEDKIYEVHGSIHYLQCTKACTKSIWENRIEDLEINMDKLEAEILPRCKNCKELARPNILMFGDSKFIDNRAAEQNKRFYNWKLKNKGKKIAVIEIGAGNAIPTVRNFGDSFSSSEDNVSLIRINPIEDEVYNDSNVGIKLGGQEGIERIYYGNY